MDKKFVACMFIDNGKAVKSFTDHTIIFDDPVQIIRHLPQVLSGSPVMRLRVSYDFLCFCIILPCLYLNIIRLKVSNHFLRYYSILMRIPQELYLFIKPMSAMFCQKSQLTFKPASFFRGCFSRRHKIQCAVCYIAVLKSCQYCFFCLPGNADTVISAISYR